MRSRLCLGISAGIFALSFLVVPADERRRSPFFTGVEGTQNPGTFLA